MIPNTIVVNGKRIGIIGLEAAIGNLLAVDGELAPSEAAVRIYEQIKDKNYIPGGLEHEYIKALEKAWLKAIGKVGEVREGGPLDIRILGPGCVSCNRLEEMVRNILEKREIEADITHIHELDEIWRYGVTKTPALIINEKLLSQGRLPTLAQVETWILEQAS